MKVVQIKQADARRACLARLCAEVYGHRAGLTPLVEFTGTLNVLFANESARLVAGVGAQGEPLALALLVLDEKGEGMMLRLACELVEGAKARLVRELVLNVPLRVLAATPSEEAFYQECGIQRWFDGEEGQRIGVSARHPATLTPTLSFDAARILRRFKHDPNAFESAKQAFLDGLDTLPETL
ncbi:hypothetical protein [Vreelandella malpeensis]|uniref:N-acetyltransferase domain-containing protein n=1 Tax=Vreelandella malpeensis TaxID=1172368 RepID=A0ABS8DW39_9GAMM|nr:hypothetical protein [Halomonas malpeensis]MCB8890263.1 hypothetical protein [Halomonas malpeensis]